MTYIGNKIENMSMNDEGIIPEEGGINPFSVESLQGPRDPACGWGGDQGDVEIIKGEDYDYINPQHYVSKDGRQTWERMVDIWGVEATALWCEMTAFKYTDTRIGNKPGEDVIREKMKVEWYLRKAHELRQKIK